MVNSELLEKAKNGEREYQFKVARALIDEGEDINFDKIVKWYKAASENGHTRSKIELAALLEKTNKKEYEPLLIKLLTELSETGEVKYKYRLAKKLLENNDKNVTQCQSLLKDCLSSDYKNSKYLLAELNRKSESIELRLESAVLFYELAQDGDKNAMYRLYLMYSTNQGIRKDKIQSEKWLKLAANAGHKTAIDKLNK